eukprot:jgi/Mesvir1/18391/Mv14272-RA.1
MAFALWTTDKIQEKEQTLSGKPLGAGRRGYRYRYSNGGFYFSIVWLGDSIAKRPWVMPLMPIVAVTFMVSILPVIMFIAYNEDFGKLNPLWPSHYWSMLRKTLTAIKDNNWKITGKDI